ncbi:hypothetical protein OUZ56_012657 [Daphnia magna]|uniref:Uncharacterized protein n=1 Tax=Daphnia magna TaxID=35525 RepID=A0ABQ9Z3P0_9CRUS|nr:hypothetical protein OUZ56_012657 [Daphnia magna]
MSKKATENPLLFEEDNDDDVDVMALVGQINDDEDEELNDINAASRKNDTFDILQTENWDPPIILPAQIRCASHTLNLIASAEISLINFDNRSLPKRNALRKAMSKMTALWNKIGHSIVAVKRSFWSV